MLGLEIKDPSGELNKFGEPKSAPQLTLAIQRAALERGLMVEKGGRDGSVIRFLPPVIISFEQLDFALRVLEEAILAAGGGKKILSKLTKSGKTLYSYGPHGQPRVLTSDEPYDRCDESRV